MPRRKLTEGEKWQIVGMRNTGQSLRQIAEHFGINHSVVSRLLKRHREDGTVKEHQRSGRPSKTSDRQNRALTCPAMRQQFTTARTLHDDWNIPIRISVRSTSRRLNNARLKARRPIKRSLLTWRHRQARFEWARYHRHWNIRSWHRVH